MKIKVCSLPLDHPLRNTPGNKTSTLQVKFRGRSYLLHLTGNIDDPVRLEQTGPLPRKTDFLQVRSWLRQHGYTVL